MFVPYAHDTGDEEEIYSYVTMQNKSHFTRAVSLTRVICTKTKWRSRPLMVWASIYGETTFQSLDVDRTHEKQKKKAECG